MPSKRPPAPKIDSAQARQYLLNAIETASEPVAVALLTKLPELGKKASAKQINEWLIQDVASANVYAWGKKAFWNRSAEAAARDHLLSAAAAAVLTAAELEKEAARQSPAVSPTTIKQAKKQLLAEGRLREVPASPGSKTKRLIDRDHPEMYLEIEIARLLKTFNVERSADQIRQLLASSGAAENSVRAAADKLFEAVNRIAFSPGTTVTFYRLRQQPELADIPKSVFDKAAFLLQNERKAVLSIHDHAAALPEEEQQPFVTDGLDHFYVSIYAR